MARFIRRAERTASAESADAATAVGTVVRPPLGESATIPHGAQIGGYTIGPQLGRGGMGVVYKAHHQRLDRPAALKLLAPALAGDAAFRERFIRESQMAARLHHPNVVTVYDAAEEEGLLYIAMQYVAGTDLRKLLDVEEGLDPVNAVRVISQIASALDTAHGNGLVHRDVKPANILMDVDRAYLGDFGLTKRFDTAAGLTGVGQIVGTVEYLAPEQIEGGRIDGRADQYALGCVAYEWLAGRPPHAKDSDIAILFAHVREEPAAVSAFRSDLPHSVNDVISRALAKNPDERYPTCKAFASDLAAELGVDAATLATSEASAHVVVVSANPTTRAIVRGSLANMGIAVSEVGSEEIPPRLLHGRFDAVVADACFGAERLVAVRRALLAADGGQGPKLLLLTPSGGEGVAAADVGAHDQLAQPFSGMQLALKLRRLLGPQAVRV